MTYNLQFKFPGGLSPRLFVVLLLAASLAACGGRRGGGYYQDDGPPRSAPASVMNTPDAVPRDEPKSEHGNKPYTALGKRYKPLASARGFVQRGQASWYGKKYHGRKTSNGEVYDMYAMTGAHPVLPLPTYVRVTNLRNNKSVVVRVNDRGPFLGGRVIDVSYTAAARLGMLGTGTAQVEVRAVFPAPAVTAAPRSASGEYAVPVVSEPLADLPVADEAEASQPAAAPSENSTAATFLQIGAFGSLANAEAGRRTLKQRGFYNATISESTGSGGQRLYLLLVGPLAGWERPDTEARLRQFGYQPFSVSR